jgi:hypothetical protein
LLQKGVDKVLSIKPSYIGKNYQKHIGSRPIAESLLLGSLLGYGAYKGAPYIARPLMKAFMPGASDREVEHALADAKRDGRLGDVAKIMGLGAGAAGALYPAVKSTNFSGSAGDAVRSYLGRDFYSQDEPAAKYQRAAHRKAVLDRSRQQKQDVPDFYKFSSFQDPLVGTNIPISYSLDLLSQDPFLRAPEKEIASSLVQGSGEDSGLTTGQNIARTALRAGVGFVPAYAFGKVMSGIAGLPEAEARRVSLAGGVAGAIYNTGIIQEFFKR